MAVVRLSTALRNAPAVNVQSCVYGIECEVKEKTDPANIVFELIGSVEKIRLIAAKTNSQVVSHLDKVAM
ncbi:hypothetical protein SEA_BILLNYE_227 [Streptomyces phage BillNye]|uniref:Uncharacterized protein n=1 Tax=Streptomyces phage BillNye TaxID=2079426 RepID=A0A2L1IW51_9CAUD|nr:hypothetical protein FDJ30_gp035 [Streptomyces phage BillNye]AVD99398.1 hypothetical protein SEA_BILLNYE_227 [Streptomyces phage BillNye]